MTAMEKNPGRIKSFFKDPIIAYAGVTVFCCRINNKNGLAARNLRGQKLRKRARQHPASDQIIDGEVADHHRRRGPDDRRNHRCEAAPVRELRIEQRVVFIEFLAELVGNHFETRAQPRRVELDGRLVPENLVAFVPPCRVGIAHDFADALVKQERLDGRRNGRTNSKLMCSPYITVAGEELPRKAVHEAGHAAVAALLSDDPVRIENGGETSEGFAAYALCIHDWVQGDSEPIEDLFKRRIAGPFASAIAEASFEAPVAVEVWTCPQN
jgi:hypothetical protein